MSRHWKLNEKRTFSEAFDASVSGTEAAARQRRKDMDKVWEEIDKREQELEECMRAVGITRPSSSDESVLRLNVGGSHVTVRRAIFEGKGCSESWTVGDLFDSVWDNRIPRDSDGCIVVDESPVCVRHAVHKLLQESGSHATDIIGGGLSPEDKAHLPYVSRALGLEEKLAGSEATNFRSTVLMPRELDVLCDTLVEWCPGNAAMLDLLYRATRDGWTPGDFHSRCGDNSPSTITLFRVSNFGPGTVDSVVGGFSSVSWKPTRSNHFEFKHAPETFVFVLKDDPDGKSTSFQPFKVGLKRGREKKAVFCSADALPHFGASTLYTEKVGNEYIIRAMDNTFEFRRRSPFLDLDGLPVVEVEVFQVCQASPSPKPPLQPGLIDLPAPDNAAMPNGSYDDDVRTFGTSIADALVEERMAQHQAQAELAKANVKAGASASALTAMYGPHVADGKKDTVVELSVQGTRMTTLRSTLHACPESALAVRFDEDKWPPTEKDLDEHGRFVIDCSPSVFSKVLDILRMRKRAAWAGSGNADRMGSALVVVKATDRASFDKFVGMYFPGCENFITDLV
ncbi:unnamed protein product, partial [Hapterophycus canaliculatus]